METTHRAFSNPAIPLAFLSTYSLFSHSSPRGTFDHCKSSSYGISNRHPRLEPRCERPWRRRASPRTRWRCLATRWKGDTIQSRSRYDSLAAPPSSPSLHLHLQSLLSPSSKPPLTNPPNHRHSNNSPSRHLDPNRPRLGLRLHPPRHPLLSTPPPQQRRSPSHNPSDSNPTTHTRSQAKETRHKYPRCLQRHSRSLAPRRTDSD